MTSYFVVPGEGDLSGIPIGGSEFGPIPYREYFVESVFNYFPKGAVWAPKRGGYFEGLLLGIMDAFDACRTVLTDLAYIRNAQLTQQLADLELDYGIGYNSALTESERRAILESRINAINNKGSAQEMQFALDVAGFDVTVYSNDPAVDPALFQTPESQLLVNGPVYRSRAVYLMTAGASNAMAGKTTAKAGKFNEASALYEYVLPTNPDLWPFVFFVGGDATFDGNGALTSLDFADVPFNRQLEFQNIILKYKPMFTWSLVNVNYS